jgi:hypothetical protein
MTESIEFTDQDRADLAALGVETDEMPTFHPVLMVWREVLKPAAAEATKKVTPQWASRMVASYNGLEYRHMDELRDRYFGKVGDLLAILEHEISTDDECLKYTTPEEDVEHNTTHYLNLLLNWQLAFLSWELEWTCTDEFAVVELAAISETHKMFFGQTGLTAFLDNIRFQYTEADQADLAAALEELRAAAEEEK